MSYNDEKKKKLGDAVKILPQGGNKGKDSDEAGWPRITFNKEKTNLP